MYNNALFEIPLDPFQYEVVAVVANDAHINSVHDLRGSRFCHPGHGLSSHWTDILANVRFLRFLSQFEIFHGISRYFSLIPFRRYSTYTHWLCFYFPVDYVYNGVI